MLSQEVLKVALSTPVAIINPRQTNRGKRESDIQKVEPTRVVKAERVSDKRYLIPYSAYNNTAYSIDTFDVAPAGEKSFGYAFKWEYNSQTVYSIVSARNVVAEWDTYMDFWTAESMRRDEAERLRALERQERAIRDQKRFEMRAQAEAQLYPMIERTTTVLLDNVKVLLGTSATERTKVSLSITGLFVNENTADEKYQAKIDGTVSLSYQDFQRLVEKVGA